jgi:hypothetical protein
LFFLGHMSWAYVWGAVFARRRSAKLYVPAILMLGILPDVDLFLRRFGVVHHTFTHSLVFWLVLLAPFLMVFRLKAAPYFAAVVQHFAFGDLLVGNGVTILWPFSSTFFGFNISMPSALDSALEILGLLLAVGIILFNGDLRRLLSAKVSNFWMFLPCLALLTSMLVLAIDTHTALVAYTLFENGAIAAILLAHIILVVFLAVSTLQGLRGLIK